MPISFACVLPSSPFQIPKRQCFGVKLCKWRIFFFHSISPCNSMIEVGLSPETNYRSMHAPRQAFRSPTSSMNVEDTLSRGEANSSVLNKSNNKSQTKMARLKNGIAKTFRCKAKTAFIWQGAFDRHFTLISIERMIALCLRYLWVYSIIYWKWLLISNIICFDKFIDNYFAT